MTDPWIALVLAIVVLFSAFEQSLTGFGFSLLLMPVATLLIGLRTASPYVALIALSLYVLNLLRFRRALRFANILPLAVAAALGVPVGVWALGNVSERAIKLVLGVVLVGYALYSLARPGTARVRSVGWGYLAGFAAGCLGGAYNTPGPPIVVYGTLREGSRDEFRGVLQSIFLLTASLSLVSHWVAQHLTANVFSLFAVTLPGLLLGAWAGARADTRINPVLFRTLVTLMVLALGVSTLADGIK